MSDFLNSLLSPSWWIGVVIVSFAINLASAYAKAPLDRLLSRLSARKRMKSERAQLEITTMLETARRQKDGVVLLSIQELRLVVIGIALVVLCILLLLLVILQPSLNNAGLSPVFLVPVLLFVAFICLRQATKIASVLSGTRQRDKLNIWPNPSAHADTQHQGVAARRMSRAYGLQRSASQTCPSAIH